jgi:hypothetical protein
VRIEEHEPLGLVELECAGERFEHGLGDTARVAELEPRVVVDADAGEDRDLLAPEARDTPCTVGLQVRLLGCDPCSPGGEELLDLVLCVHDIERSAASLALRGHVSTRISRAGHVGARSASVQAIDGHDEPCRREEELRMRATVMHGAGDVRIENVRDARLIAGPGSGRLSLRRLSV